MTFTTEKDKSSSSRFMLIRLTGRIKYVGTSYDATTYRVLVHKAPIKVTRYRLSTGGDGGTFVVLAEVSTLGAMTTGKWFYDTATGYLYFNTPAGYSYYALADFEEFVTGGVERYYARIPTAGGTNETWKPLVSTYPKFTHSIEDISAGVFSISGSSFDVINASNWADKYLVGYGSFYERDCDVWIGINTELKKVFTGTVSSVNQAGKNLSFSVLDKFNLMNKSVTFGLPQTRNTVNKDCAPGFSTSVKVEDEGKPIPKHFEDKTPHNYVPDRFMAKGMEGFHEGYCVSYDSTISGTTNRKWVCGSLKRSDSSIGELPYQVFGSTVTAVDPSGNFVSFSSSSNLVPGCFVYWKTGVNYRYGRIVAVNVAQPSPPYTVHDMEIYYSGFGPTVGSTFYSQACIIVNFIQSPESATYGTPYSLLGGLNYSVSVDSTTGNIHLTLENDFETYSPPSVGAFLGTYVNPDTDRLFYDIVGKASELKPSGILKGLVESSGLTANSASFTAAESSITGLTRFSIPYINDSNVGTYADYAARLLESIGGYFRLNESDEVELKIFSAPSPTKTLTANDYSDLSVTVEYQDVVTDIQSNNDHVLGNRSKSVMQDQDTLDTKYRVDTNEVTLALIGARKVKYLQHALSEIGSNMTRVLALNSNRRMRFKFKTATENIDTSLGDDYYIQSDNVNNGTAVAVKVVSKSVSVTGTEVEAIDIYGV